MVMIAFALLLAALQEPVSPEETVRQFQAPEGFSVKLFAGEPDVTQPVAFCIDDRGRLWAVESPSYPKGERPNTDRILIFEDTDGDGRADRRTVFLEGLTLVTGIEVGFGGVWIVAPPQMSFIPDADGDDKPDSAPVVLLDGFGRQGGHNTVNGFTWGPDGWLYAGHGRTSISDLGKPGTPAEERLHFDGGVWRYHPVRHVVEAFCDGTTNPWGVAFDDFGQAFISTCVDPHLFHAIQGAHYEPWRGRPSSQHAYGRIATIADHLHYKGSIPQSRGGKEEQLALGGGHAHCGAMVYLGDTFPDAYRGTFFVNNIHGHRVNNDTLERKGSGFVARHKPDFLVSGDRMFMGLLLQYGPDGSVYVSDWYDRGECHTYKPHRESGRIYKVVYKDAPTVKVDLAKRTDAELVDLQLHRNDWFVTRARRLLQERSRAGLAPEATAKLRGMLDGNPDATRKLRALWALHATGGVTEDLRLALLGSLEEHVRAWAIQLELEDRQVSPAFLSRLAEMARQDASPVVRLYLAAACQRMSLEDRWEILKGLAAREDDRSDPNLPLMIWYAAEPLALGAPPRAVEFLKLSRMPLLREHMARRLAAIGR